MWKCGIFRDKTLHNMTVCAIMRLQYKYAENDFISSENLSATFYYKVPKQ